ncbi:mannosyl-oligosaccharide 1,2-alpha-mannosidase MNS3 [Physcomitrium patens]|uniref:alpha-1,2-Mannosidase n=1 Tax=Physcomitrium patens TaxID=3218 RepID=A0A2K1JYF8_PHYPA|nr:mannosyl-oligosaccharide 1,2-alpha-mannosidase MNS3-like [Physcomitrium patens]PNR46559.1 hypothetical protein PHYPA_013678 [Physcomitrium patens]|eukprot:XP_024387299.1 mannosyl-oligosaccharide 1,2-alpha-mannosidase MNS3-like [Physcomitrella patens]
MAPVLPYSNKDTKYDNAKFRRRTRLRRFVQAIRNSNVKKQCGSCGIGQLLLLLLITGLMYLAVTHSKHSAASHGKKVGKRFEGTETLSQLWNRKGAPKVSSPGKVAHGGGISTTEDTALWKQRQAEVAGAFVHAWKGYTSYAQGYDELQPVRKAGVDDLGGLGVTVIDALDTAMIMGLKDVVRDAGSWIQKELMGRIAARGQVNLFETTIRVLGGLLSAYHLRGGGASKGWGAAGKAHIVGPDPEVYLDCAKDLGDRLMSAFTNSKSAVPYSDVFLKERTARRAGDFSGAASTAEATSVQLEFSYLSHVTGDSKYEKAAMAVYEHINRLPKTEGLVPIFISPDTGNFEGHNIRLGSRGDSYYEYLLKVWIQHGGAAHNESSVAYLREMYEEAMGGVRHKLVAKSEPNGLVFVGELPNGAGSALHPKMDHLVCFLAGNLALGATRGRTLKDAMSEGVLSESDLADLKLAEELGKTCYEMYNVTATGLAPEIAYFNIYGENHEVEGGRDDSFYKHDIRIKRADRHNLLRPETVESLFLLYRITENPMYREWGWKIFQAFEAHTKVSSGGYSSLDDVTSVPAPKRDKMETFFVGETLKYLYLLFGDSNVLPLTEFVFNTEAHPLPIRSKKAAMIESVAKSVGDVSTDQQADVSTHKHGGKKRHSKKKAAEEEADGATIRDILMK